jgi:hypothetical protein
MPLFTKNQPEVWFSDRMQAALVESQEPRTLDKRRTEPIRLEYLSKPVILRTRSLIAPSFYVIDSVTSILRPVMGYEYDKNWNPPCIKKQPVVLPVPLIRVQGISDRPFANFLTFMCSKQCSVGFGNPQTYPYQTEKDVTKEASETAIEQ